MSDKTPNTVQQQIEKFTKTALDLVAAAANEVAAAEIAHEAKLAQAQAESERDAALMRLAS